MVKGLKIENQSIPWLYLLAIIPLAIAALAQFNVINLQSYVPSLLTILAGLFVASEVGVMGMLRSRKLSKDMLRVFGAIVSVTAIIVAALSLVGITVSSLAPIMGTVNVLVIIYVVIEAFR